MTAGPESSFYLAHLLASMQWHRCRAHVCRNVVCAAEEANCKSSKLQKQQTAKAANCRSRKLQKQQNAEVAFTNS